MRFCIIKQIGQAERRVRRARRTLQTSGICALLFTSAKPVPAAVKHASINSSSSAWLQFCAVTRKRPKWTKESQRKAEESLLFKFYAFNFECNGRYYGHITISIHFIFNRIHSNLIKAFVYCGQTFAQVLPWQSTVGELLLVVAECVCVCGSYPRPYKNRLFTWRAHPLRKLAPE